MPKLFRSVAVCLAVIAAPALAAEPVAVVETFNAGLVDVMAHGKALGLGGRYARLLPLVRATHDMPAMTRLVVGPGWTALPVADQAALVDAFAAHSTLTYATNFAAPGGQRFAVEPVPERRGSDALVRSRLVTSDGTTVLGYRLRDGGKGWKIIDIVADGISQLAVQRAEFAATLKAGGARALTAKLTTADAAKLGR